MEAAKTERAVVPDFATVRSGLLLFLQDHTSAAELAPAIQSFKSMMDGAQLPEAAVAASTCVGVLEGISIDDRIELEMSIHFVLDQLAEIEALTLDHLTADDDFISRVSELVDESFENLTQSPDKPETLFGESDTSFEVDDEILDIFRSEASELLSTISANLTIVASSPDDQEALWEIRRAVHTFKGAAGIVGLEDASKLAHRIEDELGSLVENSLHASPKLTQLLRSSLTCLDNASAGKEHQSEVSSLLSGFDQLINDTQPKADDAPLDEMAAQDPPYDHTTAGRKPTTRTADPIVRVSLERVSELQSIAAELAASRTSLAERLEIFSYGASTVPPNSDIAVSIEALLSEQLRLSSELREKLAKIRMVRFGNLTTRLNRTVQVTCQEEGKKAEVVVENEDIELDTQIMDALVEPLLHLLRNAVVHGIETPDLRRMIGKPERATISIEVLKTDSELLVSVSDNGRGIAIGNLKEKALAAGSITPELAQSMTDEEAVELIFLPGVTTAAKLNLNAGRGIGMTIIREGIESHGGSVSVRSEAQKGTTCLIRLPLDPTSQKNKDLAIIEGRPAGPTLEEKPSELIVEEMPTGPAVEAKPADAKVDEIPVDAGIEDRPADPFIEEKPADPALEDGPAEPIIFEEIPAETFISQNAAPATINIPSSDLTVLIVDDSRLMRETITRVVQRAGWTAMSVTDGREGLKLLRMGKRPDVVVTDLEMPNLDGFGLIQAMKREPQLSSIPVIMVTSRTERIHREKALALGAAKFLTKPVEGAELKSIIHQLCLAEAA